MTSSATSDCGNPAFGISIDLTLNEFTTPDLVRGFVVRIGLGHRRTQGFTRPIGSFSPKIVRRVRHPSTAKGGASTYMSPELSNFQQRQVALHAGVQSGGIEGYIRTLDCVTITKLGWATFGFASAVNADSLRFPIQTLVSREPF